jgi:NitT/TauT family transport system permease protein
MPHLGITAFESIVGLSLGVAFGVLLAVIFVYSKTVEMSMYPYAIALKSVPIVAIAPLLIVWFGNGLLPKIIIAAIISFFPVVVNTTKGLRSIDAEAYDLFDSLSASRSQLFFKLRVPTSLPYFFAALRISATLAVIGAIVGEFAGSDKGLGFLILISSHRLETVDMFVGILLSSALGLLMFYAMAAIEMWLVPWGDKVESELA